MELPPNLKTDDASPYWMNKGDNAWQLTAATLVGLQSVPGLVILYGSIVKKKWAVNSAFMAFYAFAAVLVCWVGWGYQLSFGHKFIHFLGRPNVALDQKFLLKQAFVGMFPNATMVFFQFVFAAITLILIAGALLGRMNFYAWMMFVPIWMTFSYTVGAYSIWCPDGWLSKMGVIDYSGGFVIHLSSGVAGFTAAYWVTTATSTSTLLTWLLLDILFFEKPSVIGATQGMITGLVCITPAAGVVQGWAAIIMGIVSGSIPWYTMMVLHKKIWLLKQVDDTMAVFHTHAVAGSLGGLLAGLFAEPRLCRLFYMVDDWQHYTGLLYAFHAGKIRAGFKQLWVQILGIGFIIVLNVFMTSLICVLIRFVVPLRMSEEELREGDEAVHGEQAYALWGDGEKFENSKFNSVGGLDDLPRSKGDIQMV
ncbi:Ammonium transporter 3 member 1 [Camellia lanceoleosa]|uniref:Ammonium transporter 3 member 1 n=1 Tax=Camellia lanceoleosa TaxID=1840588 RepID=A0ACC0FT89_9ERIC|nr:Ammonium transporter 3 member 1 [Camellia lanceoleosa]